MTIEAELSVPNGPIVTILLSGVTDVTEAMDLAAVSESM